MAAADTEVSRAPGVSDGAQRTDAFRLTAPVADPRRSGKRPDETGDDGTDD